MENGNTVLVLEVLISKCFTVVWPGREIPAQSVHAFIRGVLKGTQYQKKDIGLARKNLKIRSECVNGEYVWRWENEKEPNEIWESKSKQYWGACT